MNKRLFLLFPILISYSLRAQSPRTVVVEHLTNSACSICAGKNPAFYQTLSNYPQVLHISIHPSSPHSNCVFSMQNPNENDDRTNFYSAFGYTPVIVLNGKVLPGSDPIINNTTLDTALNQTSPVEVSVREKLITSDSVRATVAIKTTGITALSSVKLFAGVAEDPINQTTPNGETVHRDVFQKTLTGITGDTFFLPAINDSITFEFGYKVKNIWSVSKLFTFAFVQRGDTKEILNGAKSGGVILLPNSVDELHKEQFSISPNPAYDRLHLIGNSLTDDEQYSIYDLQGREILRGGVSIPEINLSGIEKGTYFLRIRNSLMKFIKE